MLRFTRVGGSRDGRGLCSLFTWVPKTAHRFSALLRHVSTGLGNLYGHTGTARVPTEDSSEHEHEVVRCWTGGPGEKMSLRIIE